MSLFKYVRDLNKGKPPKIGKVKSISGTMLDDKTIQLDQWKECFAKLLNVESIVLDSNLKCSFSKRHAKTYPSLIPFQ